MRVTVKICGLTREEDALAARDAGADFLGFVFFPLSRRCLGRHDWDWIRRIEGVPKVGVFRDQELAPVREVVDGAGLDLVQLHGSETVETCLDLGGREKVIKAISVADAIDWPLVESYGRVARVLFDTATPRGGGSGRRFDWRLLEGRPSELRFWLAGGLDPENVARAVTALRPDGVDVASGVEAQMGVKDPARMRRLIAAVRLAGRQG